MRRDITIVGGGLAGLTLGLALRRRDVPVSVWEAGDYPRHKVCGEFISGRGLGVLARLGLTEGIVAAGGCWAREAAFYAGRGGRVRQTLLEPALCVSRYVLDELLAREFRAAGGCLRTHERWKDGYAGAGVVRATGRRADGLQTGERWLGLKAHARGVTLEADLELHLLGSGYVGLCRLAQGVNVCGLFRLEHAAADIRPRWKEYLGGLAEGVLHERLARAAWEEESFCAVAGMSLEPRRAEAGECALGDAHTMIAPTTGNGMSMALEAAELAVEGVERYSGGEEEWEAVRARIGAECDALFGRRLKRAAFLQRMMLGRWQQKVLALVCRGCPGVVQTFFAHTR